MDKFLLIPGDLKSTAYFPDDFDCLIKVEYLLFFENLFEGFSTDILHGEVANTIFFTGSVCLHDVGMSQISRCPCFVKKPLYVLLIGGKFFMKDFQCHRAVQGDLPRQINHPHTTAAQWLFQKEISDHGSGSQGTFGDIYFSGT